MCDRVPPPCDAEDESEDLAEDLAEDEDRDEPGTMTALQKNIVSSRAHGGSDDRGDADEDNCKDNEMYVFVSEVVCVHV